MTSDPPTSPDDPEWVDAIVKKALDQSRSEVADTATPGPADPEAAATPPSPASTGPRSSPNQATPPKRTGIAASLGAVNIKPVGAASTGADATSAENREPRPVATAVATLPEKGPYPDELVEPEALDDPLAPDDSGGLSGGMRTFLEWGSVVVGALAVALLIKTFLMQAYVIPSESMLPTLEIDDRVVVNKLSYSFGDVGRGDLVVFHRPPSQADGEDDLIKRVIALPGETIEISDGVVYITEPGQPERQRLIEPYLEEGVRTNGLQLAESEQALCVTYTTQSCELREGYLFMLGDNRGGSKDSRFFGPVSEDLVVGRAFLKVWPPGDIGFL